MPIYFILARDRDLGTAAKSEDDGRDRLQTYLTINDTRNVTNTRITKHIGANFSSQTYFQLQNQNSEKSFLDVW
jgi:hypothetical protein